MKNRFLFIILSALPCTGFGQAAFQAVMDQVSSGNPELQAVRQAHDARQSAYRVGLTPSDPAVSLDYLFGYPRSGGDQTDLIAVQSFDWPSVYSLKRNLVAIVQEEGSYLVSARQMEILRAARSMLVELISANKMRLELERRAVRAAEVYNMFERKMNAGEGNLLDANKAELQWRSIQNEMKLLEGRRNQYVDRLTMLTGGNPVVYTDTLYPAPPPLPAFDSLAIWLESIDPLLRALQEKERLAAGQVDVAKAQMLPRLEAGYHYQGLLGQQFHGLHAGVTLPLWERKNTVRQRRLETVAAQGEVAAHRNAYYYRLREAYTRYSGLKQALAEYLELLESTNNLPLLEKALRAGQISATEYYLDAMQYYALIDKALLLEKEMHLAAVELWQSGW